VNRHLAALKHGGLAFIDIDTQDIVSGIRQTGARDEAHVP
jgi:hypothetical protein